MASETTVDEVPLAEGWNGTRPEWEAATAAVLRTSGRIAPDAPDSAVWEELTHTTLDGLAVTPLGTPAVSAGLVRPPLPALPAELEGWDIRARFEDPDAAITAGHVVTDLENGVNSLWLVVGEAGIGLAEMEPVLAPVLLDLAPVVLQGDDRAADELLRIARERGVTLHPRTNLGGGIHDIGQAEQALSAGVRGYVIDATVVHDRGGSDVQELAYALHEGVKLLRALEAHRVPLPEAVGLIEFRYAATDDQFETIAKFRAARLLWAKVLELSGVAGAAPQAQHAVTSRPMMTKYDPYTNLLRCTVAAFAAGVAGAESVTVLPFDEPLGLPEAFSRRIARNTSSLLMHEAHVAKVVDPAGGSHLVESLTDDMARAAWELSKEFPYEVDINGLVASTVAARALQIAERTRPVTGVSEFPHLGEELPQRRPYPVTPYVRRYAGEFEAMRDEPLSQPVFLATIGTVAEHTARATFAANLLAAGGIGVQLADAGTHRGQPVVCVAGADSAYDERGAEVAAALRGAGAVHIVVAGTPRDWADDSAAAGLDALAFLRRLRSILAGEVSR